MRARVQGMSEDEYDEFSEDDEIDSDDLSDDEKLKVMKYESEEEAVPVVEDSESEEE